MTSFEKFGQSFQSKILHHLITDSDFALQIMDILKSEFFSNESHQTIHRIVLSWNSKYESIPSFDNIRTLTMKLYNDDEVTSDFMESFVNELEHKTPIIDKAHVIDEAVEFCKQQAFRNAILTSVDLLKNEKYDDIYAIIQGATSAGMKRDIGHDYLRDVNKRMMEERFPIGTGWAMMDAEIAGGLAAGELGLVLAGTGVGKSMILAHFAAEAFKAGKNVLYYTLELSEKMVGLRLDAKLSGIPLTNLMTDVSGSLRNRVQNELDKVKKKHKNEPRLIIKGYPTKTASIQTIKNHILTLQNDGFKPDIILVDYADLLKATDRYSDKRFELESNTEQLRGLAGIYQIPVWSASQTNRDGLDSSINGLKTISESLGKAMVADLIISIGRSQRLIDEERACYYLVKSRLGRDKIVFSGPFNTSILNFDVDEEGYEEDERGADRRNNMNRAVNNVLASDANQQNNNLNEVLRNLNLNSGGD